MPLTRADKEQIDAYIQAGEIRLARRMLEDSDDPKAKTVLEKLNRQYPPTAARPAPVSPPAPGKPVALKPASVVPSPVTTDDLDEAKQAIREKRYDDAEALLILSDHPDAEKLRSRLVQMRASVTNVEGKVKPVYVQSEKDFTTKLVISIVLLFFAFIPGIIALEIFAAEAKKTPHAPGAQGLMIVRRVVLFLSAIGAVLFVIFAALLYQVNTGANAFATSLARDLGR